MRNLEKGQHIFIAFQNGKAVLDSQLRPRIYTSLENADKWTPTVNKEKMEYVEYAPTLTPPNEPLTIEELQEIDGKPVWLDVAGGVWALVDADDGCVWLDRGGSIDIHKLSEKAYRCPPKRQEDYHG